MKFNIENTKVKYTNITTIYKDYKKDSMHKSN